jgi:hypothetical protein
MVSPTLPFTSLRVTCNGPATDGARGVETPALSRDLAVRQAGSGRDESPPASIIKPAGLVGPEFVRAFRETRRVHWLC